VPRGASILNLTGPWSDFMAGPPGPTPSVAIGNLAVAVREWQDRGLPTAYRFAPRPARRQP
jgi:hypothetical protein